MECETKVIQYADLEHENFQVTEPTIYEIHWDGVKFEFLLNQRQSNNQAVVFGNGNVSSFKELFTLPVFSRGTWAKSLPYNGIWYFDPTVYLGEATLCWYYGTNQRWYLQDIAQIIQIILKKWNVSMENTVFSGSSGGGFSSILLATMLHGKAAVINPQFIALNWHPNSLRQLRNVALFSDEDLLRERLDVTLFFQEQAYFPQLYVKQNINAFHDIESQVVPFLSQVKELMFDCKDRLHVEFYNAEGGHNAMPSTSETIEWLGEVLNFPLKDMPIIKSTGYHVKGNKLYFYLDTGIKIRSHRDEIITFSPLPAYSFGFQLISKNIVIQEAKMSNLPFCAFTLPADGTYKIKYQVKHGTQRDNFLAQDIKVINGASPYPITDDFLKFLSSLDEQLEFPRPLTPEKKRIIFSIDTESGCGDPYRIHGDLQKYGIAGNWGVPYIMDAFEKRNMRAVFFMNVYEHASFQAEYKNYIADLCAKIEARGHEVALHSHRHVDLPFYRDDLPQYDLDRQTNIIRYGCDFIQQATGVAPVSFRGGAYRIDENTFLALERNGIKVDSSCFYGRPENQRLQKYRSINQVCKIGNVLELPVTTVNHTKKLDINTLSLEKIKASLEQFKAIPDFPFIGIMFHSFSFLDETPGNGKIPLITTEKRTCYGVRPDIKARFEQLLDYIAQDNQLETATLRDCLDIGIDGSKIESDQMFIVDANNNLSNSKIQVAQKGNTFTFSLPKSTPGNQYTWGIYNDKKQLRFETIISEDAQFTYCARPKDAVYVSIVVIDSSTGKRSSEIVARIFEHNGNFALDSKYQNQHMEETGIVLPATPLKLRFRSDEISYSADGTVFTFYNECLEPETEYAFFLLDTENKVLEKTPFSTVPSASFSMDQYSGNVKIKAAAKYRGLQSSRIAAEVFCDPENNIYKIDPSYRNPIRTDHS